MLKVQLSISEAVVPSSDVHISKQLQKSTNATLMKPTYSYSYQFQLPELVNMCRIIT